MKKNVLTNTVLTIMIIVILVTMVLHFTQTNNNTRYTRLGVIINNEIVRTNDGNIWKYDTTLEKGTSVKVSFDNKKTSTIFDDEIVKIVKE